jgi:hypothetical protein
MIRWRVLPDERIELYSPVGLRLIDDFTGHSPIGWMRAQLELRDDSGNWRLTDVETKSTLSGLLAYPRLERHAEVVGRPPRRYRVKLQAEFYRAAYRLILAGPVFEPPFYRETADGIEFDAFPYNDASPPTDYTVNPPVEISLQARDVMLVPAVNYPFPTHVRVLRGEVVDASNRPVVDAEVRRSNTERGSSGAQGAFALPLRWAPNGEPIAIDAIDRHSGRMGTITITLPQALSRSQTITVS